MHDRDAELHAGVVEQVAGREVVGAVDDHVVAGDDVDDVVGRQPGVVGDDVDVGVQRHQRLLGRVDLAVADPVEVVEDLALQVGGVDLVHVDDAERADAGGGEVQRGRRAEAAGPEQQHLGAEQLGLALDADLGQQQVAHVAVLLVGVQRDRLLPRPALVLPPPEPAGHRHDVVVAELLQRAGGEGGADAAGAVHDDGAGLVGEPALDLRLEVARGRCGRRRRARPARTRPAPGRRGRAHPGRCGRRRRRCRPR